VPPLAGWPVAALTDAESLFDILSLDLYRTQSEYLERVEKPEFC
jgi:hypothetical protein